MNILESGGQAGFALVAAAFVTGLWTWVAQKAKSSEESENKESYYDIQYRENLVKGYQDFVKSLQDRLQVMNNELGEIWSRFRVIQEALDKCERDRINDNRKISDLESLLRRHLKTCPGGERDG